MMSSSPQPASISLQENRWERYFPAIVVLVAMLTYVATLRFGFVYDDNQQIVQNPLIHSWGNIPLFFKTDVWRFWNPAVVGNYWRPLFMVWLLLNFKMFGLNPVGWHLTSVLVHAAATYLGYRAVKRISNDAIIAVTAALIFAVHPVHLETVAWISGVTDSLMTCFFLGSTLCFMKGWEKTTGRTRWFVTSALLFACALLCKETAAVLPLIVIAYVAISPGKQRGEVPRLRGSMLPLAMYALVFAIYWTGRHAALAGINHSRWQINLTTLLATWPSLLWFYVEHSLWPAGLSIFYDQPPVFQANWPRFWMPLLAIAIAIVALAVAIPKTSRRTGAFATALFLVPLMPAFVLPALVPTDYAHDRYLYLSCLGFAWLIAELLSRIQAASVDKRAWARLTATVTIVIALSAAASAQIVYFANDLLLFDRATRIAPGNLTGFSSLAKALLERDRTAEAMSIFRQIIQVDRNNWPALYNLSLFDFQNGNYSEAETYLRRATDLNTTDADSFALLADVLNHQAKFVDAEQAIRHALTLRPSKPGYRTVLARSLYGEGRQSEAMEQIRAELQAHPDEQDALALLRLLQSQKR